MFKSKLLRSTIAFAEIGNNGGSHPRANAPCDFASASVSNRVVTPSLHPVSASNVMMERVERMLLLRFWLQCFTMSPDRVIPMRAPRSVVPLYHRITSLALVVEGGMYSTVALAVSSLKKALISALSFG